MAFKRGFSFLILLSAFVAGSSAHAQTVLFDPEVTVNPEPGQPATHTFDVTNLNDDSVIIQAVTPDNPACTARFTQEPIGQNHVGKIIFSCPIHDEEHFYRQARVQLHFARSGVVEIDKISMSGKTLEDCGTPINLSDPGGSMEKEVKAMPFLMQVGGSCSYHSAVQLYDALRSRDDPNSVKQFSSPLAVDYEMKVQEKGPDLSGGNVRKNMLMLRDNGACPRTYFNSSTGRDADETVYNYLFSEFMNMIAESEKQPNDLNQSRSTILLLKLLNRTSNITQTLSSQLKRWSLFKVNPNPDREKLNAAIDAKDFIQFVRELAPPVCAPQERIFAPHYSVIDQEHALHFLGWKWRTNSAVVREIEKELDKGIKKALPIAISYCSSVLNRGRSYAEITDTSSEACGAHASVVLGRRRSPAGRCQYLIRNTWGRKNCYQNNDWECVPSKGMVWVDAKTLAQSVYRTTRIEE